MPLGFERLNVRKQPPNKLITFVEALNGPDKAIAQDFLERIAAIVYPIMKDNGLAVVSLDEFPPNLEFWGRNFNAGECIQIVLKNPKTGQWLPFQFVQGVMIHELAHIKQMNHSRAFWAVNNRLSGELRLLRSKGYTGEGFWSAGRVLISAEYTQDRPLAESDMPHSLCGGTYRSRERRRKNRSTDDQSTKKPKLTYAERQQRKKEKKFGTGEGNKVGADEDTRVELEKGKSKNKGVPKVAQSNRGRELRAAAALKRFETQEKDTNPPKRDEDGGTGDETDYDETADEDEDEKAIDVGGGKFLVPVSREQDGKTEQDEMKRELLKLAGACGTGGSGTGPSGGEKDEKQRTVDDSRKQGLNPRGTAKTAMIIKSDNESDEELIGYDPRKHTSTEGSLAQPRKQKTGKQIEESHITISDVSPRGGGPNIQRPIEISGDNMNARELACSACSVVNEDDAVLCVVCANVLEPGKMPNAWMCSGLACGGSTYRNAGDVGICGICGLRKSASKVNR